MLSHFGLICSLRPLQHNIRMLLVSYHFSLRFTLGLLLVDQYFSIIKLRVKDTGVFILTVSETWMLWEAGLAFRLSICLLVYSWITQGCCTCRLLISSSLFTLGPVVLIKLLRALYIWWSKRVVTVFLVAGLINITAIIHIIAVSVGTSVLTHLWFGPILVTHLNAKVFQLFSELIFFARHITSHYSA